MKDYQPPTMEQSTFFLSERLLELQSQYRPISSSSASQNVEMLRGLQNYDLMTSIYRLMSFLGQIEKLLKQQPKLPEYRDYNVFTNSKVLFSEKEISELQTQYVEELHFYKEKVNNLLCYLELQTTPSDKTKFSTDLSVEKIVGIIKVLMTRGDIKNDNPSEIARLIASTFSSKKAEDPSEDKLRNILYADCGDDVSRFLIDLGGKMQELAKRELGGEPALRITRKRKKN